MSSSARQQMRLYLRQSAALGRKNVLIRARSWQLNLAHLISSIFVIFIIWAVDQAVQYSGSEFTGAKATPDPAATHVSHIPDCNNNIYLKKDVPCKSFLYTPANNSLVDDIVDSIRHSNNPPLAKDQVMAMNTREEVDEHLLQNPQTAMGAIHFRNLTEQAGPSLAYTIQTNDTAAFFKGQFQDPNTYLQLPLQVAVEREFVRRAINEPDLVWDVAIKNFPHPSLETESTIGRVAPVFIMASLMFNVVMLLQNVVGERETGVRGAMVSMGLLDSAYWTSVICMEILNSVMHSAILTLFCMAFQFDMALKNEPALLFILLLLSALALSSGSLVLSVLVRKADLAVPVSLVIFIIAWVFIMVLSFGFPYNGTTHQGIVAVFSLFPWSLLSKGLLDLANATTGTNDGLTWETRGEYCWVKPPPPETQDELRYWTPDCILNLSEMYYILLGQAGGYLLMALYLDAIVPQEPGGTALPWYFLWMPSFWSSNKGFNPSHAQHALEAAQQQEQQKAVQPAEHAALPATHTLTTHPSDPAEEEGISEISPATPAAHSEASTCLPAERVADRVEGGAEGEGKEEEAKDPDVAAETAQVRAICARFLSAHSHPSLHAHSSTTDEALPTQQGAEGAVIVSTQQQHAQHAQHTSVCPSRSSHSGTSAGGSDGLAVSAAAEQRLQGWRAGPVTAVRKEGSVHSSQATAGSASSSAGGDAVACEGSGLANGHVNQLVDGEAGPSSSTSSKNTAAGSAHQAPRANHASLNHSNRSSSSSHSGTLPSPAAATRAAAARQAFNLSCEDGVMAHGHSAARQPSDLPSHASSLPNPLLPTALSCSSMHSAENPSSSRASCASYTVAAAPGGSSSAGSLHMHAGTEVQGGSARTVTGSSLGTYNGSFSARPAPQHTDASASSKVPQMHDQLGQCDLGAESSDPSSSLPPGVHLFGLQKAFLRAEWWTPQFWLAKGCAEDVPELKQSGAQAKSSVSVRLLRLCWPSSVLGWLQRWWAARLAANTLMAVNGVWLSFTPGNCFCLLGPNGAGKTTIIKCLTGAAQASGGDALVWGHSVRSPSGLSAARAVTGVCPQFDVLWPQLTGREHLTLFSHIKGLPVGAPMEAEAEALLKQVGLTKAGGLRSGAYSGGMRRRLSLAIALLGDPALLVLDEPTTGLDPVSRRGVWNLLSSAKHGRVMLLTTHSMEEADVLGDRIGIIAAGMLRCLGSGLRLKARFGDGIRVSVALALRPEDDEAALDARREVVRQSVQQQLDQPNLFLGHPKLAPQHPQPAPASAQLQEGSRSEADSFEDARSCLLDSLSREQSLKSKQEEAAGPSCTGEKDKKGQQGSGGSVQEAAGSEKKSAPSTLESVYEHFMVPKEQEDALPELFLCLEELSASVGIVDIQTSLTPLEDVFLRVVKGHSASR